LIIQNLEGVIAMVFLHVRDAGKSNWVNTEREFSRVPGIGEYVYCDKVWSKVEVVIHISEDQNSDYVAEVYAVKTTEGEALKILDYHEKE
jgi:hypothetical protein